MSSGKKGEIWRSHAEEILADPGRLADGKNHKDITLSLYAFTGIHDSQATPKAQSTQQGPGIFVY